MIGRFALKIRKLYQRMTASLSRMVFTLMKHIPFLSNRPTVSVKLLHQFNPMPTSPTPNLGALSDTLYSIDGGPMVTFSQANNLGPIKYYSPTPRPPKYPSKEKPVVSTPPPPAKFRISEIVYLLTFSREAEYDTPLVHSKHCIDLKILSVNQHNGYCWTYEVISGKGRLLSQISESDLISVSEYRLLKSKHNYYFLSLEDTELFPKDTIFYINEDYLYSPFLEIYISKPYF